VKDPKLSPNYELDSLSLIFSSLLLEDNGFNAKENSSLHIELPVPSFVLLVVYFNLLK